MTLHWTKVKKAVEDAGGTWTTREEGEAFLSGAPVMLDLGSIFDPSKPHSKFIGHDDRFPGAVYGQGGSYFDKHGKRVG